MNDKEIYFYNENAQLYLDYELNKQIVDKTITNLAQYKVDKIATYVYMFNYRWYGKKPSRDEYKKLFNIILEILKEEIKDDK